MFDLVFLLSDFVMSIEDSIYEFRSKQRSLYVYDCLVCKSGKGGWKVSCLIGDGDGVQKLLVGCKMNVELIEFMELIESFF